MKNNILLIILIFIVFIGFYLLYSKQNSLEKSLLEQISLIKKESTSDKEGIKDDQYNLDYKENNLVTSKTINFVDSINKLIDDQLGSDNIIKNDSLDLTVEVYNINDYNQNIEQEVVVEDTLCYGLSEQYKIINFYKNRIRIKNLSEPGSKLILTGDTLYYDNLKYLVLDVNLKEEYIRLLNLNNNKDCYFFKN